MSIDINQPLPPNSDVVLNHEDGTQTLGTPEDLAQAKDANQLIGLHVSPAVVTPDDGEASAEESDAEVAEEAPATPEVAPEAPEETPEAPTEEAAETPAEETAEDAPGKPAGE